MWVKSILDTDRYLADIVKNRVPVLASYSKLPFQSDRFLIENFVKLKINWLTEYTDWVDTIYLYLLLLVRLIIVKFLLKQSKALLCLNRLHTSCFFHKSSRILFRLHLYGFLVYMGFLWIRYKFLTDFLWICHCKDTLKKYGYPIRHPLKLLDS